MAASEITLVLGNRNYSSWSMRAALAASLAGAAAREIVIPLDRPETREAILAHSPSGRVPALIVDGVAVWDSLAICETLAERFPEAALWPADPAARAVARSVTAEMHSGFEALRRECSMDLRRRGRKPRGEAWRPDAARIVALWNDCLARFGGDEGFLFGAPGIADCFYAPVVSRFVTYDLPLEGAAVGYVERVQAWAPYRTWAEAAAEEPWDLGEDH